MDNNAWNMEALKTAVRILNEVGEFVPNYEKACDLAREAAKAYGEPEAGWFMGDVLNVMNEMDMEGES